MNLCLICMAMEYIFSQNLISVNTLLVIGYQYCRLAEADLVRWDRKLAKTHRRNREARFQLKMPENPFNNQFVHYIDGESVFNFVSNFEPSFNFSRGTTAKFSALSSSNNSPFNKRHDSRVWSNFF